MQNPFTPLGSSREALINMTGQGHLGCVCSVDIGYGHVVNHVALFAIFL